MTKNEVIRMDIVGIVVESLDDAIAFFTELGLKLEGRKKKAFILILHLYKSSSWQRAFTSRNILT